MKFYESEYEEALIGLLQQEGWEYTHGGNIRRNNRDILISRDLRQYLQERYPALEANDLDEIVSYLQHTGGQTHFLIYSAIRIVYCETAIAILVTPMVRFSI